MRLCFGMPWSHACASLQRKITLWIADELLNSMSRFRPEMATTPDSSYEERHASAPIEQPEPQYHPEPSSRELHNSPELSSRELHNSPEPSSGDGYLALFTYEREVASPTPEETAEEQDASTRNESPDQQESQDSSFNGYSL